MSISITKISDRYRINSGAIENYLKKVAEDYPFDDEPIKKIEEREEIPESNIDFINKVCDVIKRNIKYAKKQIYNALLSIKSPIIQKISIGDPNAPITRRKREFTESDVIMFSDAQIQTIKEAQEAINSSLIDTIIIAVGEEKLSDQDQYFLDEGINNCVGFRLSELDDAIKSLQGFVDEHENRSERGTMTRADLEYLSGILSILSGEEFSNEGDWESVSIEDIELGNVPESNIKEKSEGWKSLIGDNAKSKEEFLSKFNLEAKDIVERSSELKPLSFLKNPPFEINEDRNAILIRKFPVRFMKELQNILKETGEWNEEDGEAALIKKVRNGIKEFVGGEEQWVKNEDGSYAKWIILPDKEQINSAKEMQIWESFWGKYRDPEDVSIDKSQMEKAALNEFMRICLAYYESKTRSDEEKEKQGEKYKDPDITFRANYPSFANNENIWDLISAIYYGMREYENPDSEKEIPNRPDLKQYPVFISEVAKLSNDQFVKNKLHQIKSPKDKKSLEHAHELAKSIISKEENFKDFSNIQLIMKYMSGLSHNKRIGLSENLANEIDTIQNDDWVSILNHISNGIDAMSGIERSLSKYSPEQKQTLLEMKNKARRYYDVLSKGAAPGKELDYMNHVLKLFNLFYSEIRYNISPKSNKNVSKLSNSIDGLKMFFGQSSLRELILGEELNDQSDIYANYTSARIFTAFNFQNHKMGDRKCLLMKRLTQ